MRIEMGWGNDRQIFSVESKKQFKSIAGTKTISGMGLNLSWQGKPSGAVEQKPDEYKTQVDVMKEQLEAQRKGAAIKALENKLMAGKTLTAEELEFLQEHCPDLYEKAMKIAREREAYRKELEQAKSKEEVLKIQERHLRQFATELKYIPKSDVPAMKFLTMRMNGILDEHHIFTQTDEYKRLPDKSDEPEKSKDEDEDKAREEENKPEIQDEEADDSVQYLNNAFDEISVSASEDNTQTTEVGAKTETKVDLPDTVSGEAGTAGGEGGGAGANTPSIPNVGAVASGIDVKA